MAGSMISLKRTVIATMWIFLLGIRKISIGVPSSGI